MPEMITVGVSLASAPSPATGATVNPPAGMINNKLIKRKLTHKDVLLLSLSVYTEGDHGGPQKGS